MIEKYRSQIDSETALVSFFSLVALYMFAESFTFSPDAATFPRLMAAMTILFGVVILFRGVLPDNIREYLFEQEIISIDGEEIKDDTEIEEGEAETRTEALNRPLHLSTFTGFMTVLFLIGSYLVGLFWVTPIFVIAYLIYFRQPWSRIVIVTLISIIGVYAFIEFLNAPFFEGELFRGI